MESVGLPRIPVAAPFLGGNEKAYVLDCLDSTWISSSGKYITAFEQAFAEFCGVNHAVAVNNGTTALHLALVGLGLQPGDEVIVPTVTYIATANAVTYCGATPVLVDVCPLTLNLDVAQVEALITPRTRGIIPVHLYGHPVDIVGLRQLADRRQLWIVEDAAEAHGAEVNGQRVGGFGSCATFSFFGNKILTTGEGGMITTNDEQLAARLRLFRGQGMDLERRYWFPVVGYNYRMTNIQAALGVAQLENVEEALQARQQLAGWYRESLDDLQEKIILPAEESWAHHVYWMFNILLRFGGESRRDSVMRHLGEDGIETRPTFYPMHVLPPYYSERAFPVADLWASRGINLPTHQLLTRQDVERVAGSLREALSVL